MTRRRGGFSLIEVMVVLTLIGILVMFSAPSFQMVLEQSRADVACANLRAVWAAQRLYWIEYRVFTPDLGRLQSLGVLDPAVASAARDYSYQINSADANAFSAAATRIGSPRWTGQFTIDSTGTLDGSVQAGDGSQISPGNN
jgi:prepilin-type N-terminal cleavage/methylation domain-containing protein